MLVRLDAAKGQSATERLKDYEPWVIRYPTFQNIEKSVDELQYHLDNTFRGRTVVVVGHSMGGLVAGRQMIRNQGGQVAKLLALGTPWLGSPLANPKTVVLGNTSYSACSISQTFGGSGATTWLTATAGGRDLSDVGSFIKQSIASSLGAIEPKIDALFGDLSQNHYSDLGARPLSTFMTYSACVLKSLGYSASDGVVPVASATAVASSPAGLSRAKKFDGYDHMYLTEQAPKAPDDLPGEVLGRLVALAGQVAPVVSVLVRLPLPNIVSVGQGVQLTAELRDFAGFLLTGRPVTWTSSDPSTVTIDVSTGQARALKAGGPVTLTASAEGRSGGGQLLVTTAPRLPGSFLARSYDSTFHSSQGVVYFTNLYVVDTSGTGSDLKVGALRVATMPPIPVPPIRLVDYPPMVALAECPNGQAFSVSRADGFSNAELWIVDRNTAVVTLVGSLPGRLGRVTALSCDGANQLFAGTDFLASGRLFRVDRLTAAATEIGGDPSGKAWRALGDPSPGPLYAVATEWFSNPVRDQLVIVDRTTGIPTPVLAGQYLNLVGVSHLVWRGGQLFGINPYTIPRGILVELDPSTGLVTKVVRFLGF